VVQDQLERQDLRDLPGCPGRLERADLAVLQVKLDRQEVLEALVRLDFPGQLDPPAHPGTRDPAGRRDQPG